MFVHPQRPADGLRLAAALRALADEDPLIDVGQDPNRGVEQAIVRLYGQLQRQVLTERLTEEFGIPVQVSRAHPIHKERPTGVGEALKVIDQRGPNAFMATIGLRTAPGAHGSGVHYQRAVELGSCTISSSA